MGQEESLFNSTPKIDDVFMAFHEFSMWTSSRRSLRNLERFSLSNGTANRIEFRLKGFQKPIIANWTLRCARNDDLSRTDIEIY